MDCNWNYDIVKMCFYSRGTDKRLLDKIRELREDTAGQNADR
jgi:hypothetical protein